MAGKYFREPRIRVTKLDAARRQLRTAIQLWFADGDPVAIHTLLSAAHEILDVLHRNEGLSDLLFDSVLIKDEYRKLWMRAVKANANFFKHADRDSDAVTDFSPSLNEMLTLFCISALHNMKQPLSFDEETFSRWIRFNRPEIVKEGANDGIPAEQIANVRGASKADFYKAFQIVSQKTRP